jgi:hypothetical protein
MTRADRKFLCGALAFAAVIARDKEKAPETMGAATEQIQKLAALIDAYCTAHVVGGPLGEEASTETADELVELHTRELREKGETRLPEDWQMLMHLHDRLLHRQARRKWREFYSPDNEAKLANLVLALLDKEIDGDSRAKLA